MYYNYVFSRTADLTLMNFLYLIITLNAWLQIIWYSQADDFRTAKYSWWFKSAEPHLYKLLSFLVSFHSENLLIRF